MECEEFILPDWSPPDDSARPCRPKAGYGLVVMMMMVIMIVMNNDDDYDGGTWSFSASCVTVRWRPLFPLARQLTWSSWSIIYVYLYLSQQSSIAHHKPLIPIIEQLRLLFSFHKAVLGQLWGAGRVPDRHLGHRPREADLPSDWFCLDGSFPANSPAVVRILQWFLWLVKQNAIDSCFQNGNIFSSMTFRQCFLFFPFVSS